MRGIYKIENKLNNRLYIGESMNILKRWKEHKEDLNNNKHHSYKLQSDWNKYGESNFKFNLVAVIDDDIKDFVANYLLVIYEDKYIELYDSINNGYNVENTLNEILNKKKGVLYNNSDSGILKTYIDYVEKKIYCNESGIIYQNSFSLNKIAKHYNITNIELKKILIDLNIVKKGVKNILFNESIIPNDSIITNGTFSKVKFDRIAYEIILNTIIDSGKLSSNLPKNNQNKNNYTPKVIKETNVKRSKENIDIFSLPIITEEETQELNEDAITYYSLKEIIDSLEINDTYNNILYTLRENNVLEYKQYNNRKINTLKNNNKSLYSYVKKSSKNNNTYITLYLTELGKSYIVEEVLKLYNK